MPTTLNEEREEWTVYQHQQQIWGVITVTQSEIPGTHHIHVGVGMIDFDRNQIGTISVMVLPN